MIVKNLRRREEIDLNLEYPDGSNIFFFPISKTIISYYQQIQKSKWMEPELDQIDKYWGGYGLSYVYIGIPCIIYDWLQDSLSECFSYAEAQICLDEEDCEEIMGRAELGRNDTHVWVEAEVKDKICGMSKDGERFQSSITHYMFLNKKSVQGRGSIRIRLRRFYENDWSSQKSDWYLLFQIDRLHSYELVDTRFDDDDCKP